MIRAPGTSAEIGASPCGSSAAMPSHTAHAKARGRDRDPDVAERVTAQGRSDPARGELRHEGQADDHSVPDEVRPAPERKLPGDDARDPERAHQADAEIQHQHHAEGDQEERASARLVGCARHAAGDHAAEAELARDDVRVLVRGVLADTPSAPEATSAVGRSQRKARNATPPAIRPPARSRSSSTASTAAASSEFGPRSSWTRLSVAVPRSRCSCRRSTVSRIHGIRSRARS